MSGAGFLRGTTSPANTLTARARVGADGPFQRGPDGRLRGRGGDRHRPARGERLADDPVDPGPWRDGAVRDQGQVDLGLPAVPGGDGGLLAGGVGGQPGGR